jgi:hypothetical protein
LNKKTIEYYSECKNPMQKGYIWVKIKGEQEFLMCLQGLKQWLFEWFRYHGIPQR